MSKLINVTEIQQFIEALKNQHAADQALGTIPADALFQVAVRYTETKDGQPTAFIDVLHLVTDAKSGGQIVQEYFDKNPATGEISGPCSVAYPNFKFDGWSPEQFIHATINHPNHPHVTNVEISSAAQPEHSLGFAVKDQSLEI
ncbi:MAG: hypothetical protein WAX89_05790 [Alphaproteobacteria bacterium]